MSLRRYCQPGASLGKQLDLDDENASVGEDGYWEGCRGAGRIRPSQDVTVEGRVPSTQQEIVDIINCSERIRPQGTAGEEKNYGQLIGNIFGHWQEGLANACQMTRYKFLDVPFDPTATEASQASVVNCPVTQDIDLVRFDEEAFTDDIAGGSTWEYLQLLRPWDVGIPHAFRGQKGQVNSKEGRVIRKEAALQQASLLRRSITYQWRLLPSDAVGPYARALYEEGTSTSYFSPEVQTKPVFNGM